MSSQSFWETDVRRLVEIGLSYIPSSCAVARAARRAREGIADSIGLRDAMDRSRKTAPLRCPESAERIDTSNMTKEEVVRLTLSLILES